jgi:hypothetical protein
MEGSVAQGTVPSHLASAFVDAASTVRPTDDGVAGTLEHAGRSKLDEPPRERAREDGLAENGAAGGPETR